MNPQLPLLTEAESKGLNYDHYINLQSEQIAFSRYCFDGVPKALIDIYDNTVNTVSVDIWNHKGVII